MRKVTITDIKKPNIIAFLKKIQTLNTANTDSNPSGKEVVHFKYEGGVLMSDCMHRHDMYKRVLTDISNIGLVNFHGSSTQTGFICVIHDGKYFIDYISKRSDKLYIELMVNDNDVATTITACDSDGSKKKFACNDETYFLTNDLWESQVDVADSSKIGTYNIKKETITKFKDGLKKSDIESDTEGVDYIFSIVDTLCVYVDEGVLKGKNLFYEGILSTDFAIADTHFIANEKIFLLDANTDYKVTLLEADTYGRRMLFEEIEGDDTKTLVICAETFDPDNIDYDSYN